jgi:LPXTG-motif cell wall-anchored protein
MIRRIALVAGTLLLVLVGLAAPAQAGLEYPPSSGISINPTTVDPGGQVTVTGDGCEAGAEVTISLGDSQVATVTAGEDGTFSTAFQVPSSTAAGTYSVNASGCAAEVLSTTLTVRASGTTPAPTGGSGGSSLPRTGSDTTESLLRVAVVLVAFGGLLVFVARRRSASRS